MKPQRAWMLLQSGGRLDLLDPKPDAWTDEDLAIGLSRTYRWGGYSAWDLPLSVAQHSLAVLALRKREGKLAPRDALRELLHDATEALVGGIDPIMPLKPHLGEGFAQLDRRLQDAVDRRYGLPPWTDESYALHKRADRQAAANEAYHVVGWSRDDIRSSLQITLEPLDHDPLPLPPGMSPWEPWPPNLAKDLFLERLGELGDTIDVTETLDEIFIEDTLARLAEAFSRLPEAMRRRCRHLPTGKRGLDTLVQVEADDGSQCVEGVVVDGERNESGAFYFDDHFLVFSTEATEGGELIRCNGANCHVEIL
ncbi:hypothetical protein [Methylosinus sp. LW4]|uniref:hypothetical protein n=1 Tax=Methylosinus sp. LW4 TaxID=136993 RepID=UPI0003AB1137|nr:hypothetical protein [Methylosinus sp. LW4]